MKDFLQDPVFGVIQQEATRLNVEAFVVGGFVRDKLIGRSTVDVDVVVLGSGIELAKAIAKSLGEGTDLIVYKKFGTAMVKSGRMVVEIVGARKESYREDSRKPIIEDGTFEDDINRRDFTINTLALSLSKENYGELIDLVGGVQDLHKQLIKTPLDPDKTFSDDPLRMMRAIRFATQLNFRIEDKTFEAITTNKDRLKIVSMERTVDELNKIILSDKPSMGFKMLYNTGLLQLFFPDMVRLQGVDIVRGKQHKDNFYHTLQVLDNICKNTDNLWLRWSAVLHDIAKPATKRFDNRVGWTFHGHDFKGAKMVPAIFRSLKLPLNEKMRYVQKMVRLHLRPIGLAKSEVTDSGIRRLLFDAADDVDDLMTLCEADITSKNEYKVKKFLNNFKLVRQKLKEVEENDHLRNWQPPITGEMIMNAFSISAGREVGEIKTAIREAILNGELDNNEKDAYDFMIKKGVDMGLQK